MFIGLIKIGGSLSSNRKAGPALVDINSNEHLYYLFTTSAIKCGGRCNTIDDQYAQMSIPNKVSVKAYDLMLGVNVT